MEFKKLNNLFELYQIQSERFSNLDFLHSIDRNKKVDALKWSDVSKKIEIFSTFLNIQESRKEIG